MAEAIAVRGLPRPRRDGRDRRRFGKDGVVGHRHLHVHSFDRRRTIAEYPNERKRLTRRCTPLARVSSGNCGGNAQPALTSLWALTAESAPRRPTPTCRRRRRGRRQRAFRRRRGQGIESMGRRRLAAQSASPHLLLVQDPREDHSDGAPRGSSSTNRSALGRLSTMTNRSFRATTDSSASCSWPG
jgi:hypothetical protein